MIQYAVLICVAMAGILGGLVAMILGYGLLGFFVGYTMVGVPAMAVFLLIISFAHKQRGERS